MTPLHYAACNDASECIRVLHNKCNINHANKGGWTALHLAAQYGRHRATAVLLELGANADLEHEVRMAGCGVTVVWY